MQEGGVCEQHTQVGGFVTGLGCVQERGVNTGEGWDAKKRDVHRRGMGCAQEKKVHGGFERNVVETRHGE